MCKVHEGSGETRCLFVFGGDNVYKVQPIRDMEVLNKCYEIAREHDRNRRNGAISWELLLMIGFNTSLRISDIQRLRVRDIRGQDYCEIKAKKTGKIAKILINPAARRELQRLLRGKRDDEFLIESRVSDPCDHKRRAITRQRAWQIMNIIAARAGIKDHIGCHTLRKTFGYWYYKQTNDAVSLQRILGHTSRRDTLVYIGVVQEDIDETLKHFNILTGRTKV